MVKTLVLMVWKGIKARQLPNNEQFVGALAVFGLLLTTYLLTFNGQFTSIDELAIYARAGNLVQQGKMDTPQLAFSAYHNPVGEIEAGYAILAAPLYWLAQQVGRFNNIQVVMLLNPFLTAVTGAVLYLIARTLGYSHRGAALAALAYGLTTLAWPYSRTLYREPLVGLGWVVGLYGLVLWRYQKRTAWFWIGSLILVLTVPIKITAVAALPFIFLATLAKMNVRYRLYRSIGVVVIASLIVAVLFQLGFTIRFGSAWDPRTLSRWPLLTGLQRIYGQLLSPGKGLLFYMPVLILVIPGLIAMYRRHRLVTLAVGLPLLSTAAAYSIYNNWFGGQSWGPRFLVPAIPLIMVSLAPLWDSQKQRRQRVLLLVVLALSFVIQLGVVSANWWPGYKPLFLTGSDPEDNAGLLPANVLLSPPLVQLRDWGPDALDLLWYHPSEAPTFSPGLALGMVAAVLAAAAAWWLIRRKNLPTSVLLLPPALAVTVLLFLGPNATPGYPGLTAEQGKELAAWAASDNDEPYTLVTMSNEFHIFFYLGYLKGNFIHHWYSPAQVDGFEPILAHSMGEEVSLIMDRGHIDPAFSGKELEWWLNEQLFRVESDWVGDYELVHYANLPLEDWTWHPVTYQFGDSFTLTRFSTNQEMLQPGDMLGLQLDLCRSGSLPEYHNLFIHLQKADTQINGNDGPIRYGGTMFIPWEVGDCLLERRAIAIPADAGPGVYDIIAGFDTPDGLLPVQENGIEQGDYSVLGPVTIVP
ncbi:MAG: hypothetical protein WAM60_25620 [Candidatus Promineifilaceae bacterium]